MNFSILFLILIAVLIIAYILIDIFVFKTKDRRSERRNRLINYLLVIGFVLLVVLYFLTMPTEIFLQNIIDTIISFCILALATTGIVLIFKTSVTTNFAQGMMATVAAFVSGVLAISFTASLGLPQALTVLITMIIGALVSFMIGLFIDTMIIRKSKNVTPVGKQMITMGLVLVISGLIPIVFGTNLIKAPEFSSESIGFNIGKYNLRISVNTIYTMIITVIALGVLFAMLKFTKWGLGVRATASNEVVAGIMGVNTKVITAMSWAIAGALGGIAAVIYAPTYGNLTSALMIPTQVNGFMAAILGGFSSFGGSLIGAFLIPFLGKMFSYYNSSWYDVIVYVFILFIVLIKPLGLLGKKIAKKV